MFCLDCLYWLTKSTIFVFAAKNLEIYQVLAKNSHAFKEDFVPVLKRTVKSQVLSIVYTLVVNSIIRSK